MCYLEPELLASGLSEAMQAGQQLIGGMQVLREWHFDWQYMMRGLIIDKKRGNMLKVP